MRRIVALCSVLQPVSSVLAQGSFTTVPAQAPWTGTGAMVVSASGQVAAGGELGGSPGRALRWVAPGLSGAGVTILAVPPGAFSAAAHRISADGNVIAGMYKLQASGPDALARWSGAGPAEPLGALPGAIGGGVRFVSADGSVICGTFSTGSSDSTVFRWTASGGVQDLGVGDVNGMSADGSVLVGSLGPIFGTSHTAFRWTASGGMQTLGVPGYSGAMAVSADGTIVALGSGNSIYRWTVSGGYQDLGSLPNYQGPASIGPMSADGSEIFGACSNSFNGFAVFRWTVDAGMTQLYSYYAGNGESLAFQSVSADGSVALGVHATHTYTEYSIWTVRDGLHLSQRDYAQQRGADVSGAPGLFGGTSVSADGRVIGGYSYLTGSSIGWVLSLSDCYANCDASVAPPLLNVQDFTCFLGSFARGTAYANCDGSTTAPVLNVLDFTCFLQRFAAGCTR